MKKELTDKVGKKFFLSDDYKLEAILNYKSGISTFDEYLNGKTLKQIHAVIHLIKYPKGLVFKIMKNFSSFAYGIAYSEIKRTLIFEKPSITELVIETIDNKRIVFSLKTSNIFEVKHYFEKIHLKYDFESSITNNRQAFDTVYNSKKRKK
jgi:hypothetical protein